MSQIGSTIASVCDIGNIQLTVNAVSDNIIIISCATGPRRELCSANKESHRAHGELIKNTVPTEGYKGPLKTT